MRFSLSLFTLLIFSLSSFGEIEFKKITPPVIQQGTSQEIIIEGTKLDLFDSFFFYKDGLSIESPAISRDKKTLKVTLKADSNTAHNYHNFRLLGKDGLSNQHHIFVTPYSVSKKNGKNLEFDLAQEIETPTTVHGSLTSRRADYYKFKLKKKPNTLHISFKPKAWTKLY